MKRPSPLATVPRAWRVTIPHGVTHPDAGFRNPACPPNAAISIVALHGAYRAGIGAGRRRGGRMRGHDAQSDGKKECSQGHVFHSVRQWIATAYIVGRAAERSKPKREAERRASGAYPFRVSAY
jgi:hypothetical protein